MLQEKNQLRLSLEIKALKQHEFTAQLYFVVRPISELGMKTFRTSPTQAITNARVETQFKSFFKSFFFESNNTQLKQSFAQDLFIELWHNDRIKKDVLLGIAKLPLSQILTQQLKKTKEGYLLVYDVWLPVDQVDESENSIKKIGSVRVVMFLEDLGPVQMLKKNGFSVKNYIDQEQVPVPDYNAQLIPNERNFNSNPLPSEKYQGDQMNQELNQLQHKVVWELEAWKKAQEARTRLILKQKQATFWQNLSQQQKKSDLQKQKQFKKMQANINLLEQKLKTKMNDLIKRQQKLVVMQQQLQTKMNEISREVFLKDEQIERLKRKHKEQKTVTIKQKSNLELEMAKLRAQNAKLKVQLEQALKEDQKSQVNIMRSQASHRIAEIKALRKELENCMETKQEFKQSYQKMKRQVIERGALLAEKNDQLNVANHEISLLKKDIKHLQEKLVYLKQQQFYGNNYGYGAPTNDNDQAPIQFSSQRQKLIYKRREMLQAGNYTVNDPLIKQIDKKIATLS